MDSLDRIRYEAFMLSASPEVIYQEFQKRYDSIPAKKIIIGGDFCSEALANKLIKRKEKLVRVALASFCPEQKILYKLYETDELKPLVLANKFNFGSLSSFFKDHAQELISQPELLAIAFVNPSFRPGDFADFLLREKPFNKLKQKEWEDLLIEALESPVLKPTDPSDYHRAYDGWAWYTDNRPHNALTQVLLKLPKKSVELTRNVLGKIHELSGAILSDEEKAKYDIKEDSITLFATLQKILEHWSGWDTQKPHDSLDIRTELITKVPPFDTKTMKWVENSKDDKLIVGLYAIRTNLKPSDVKSAYKRFGSDFIVCALRNDRFFHSHRGKPSPLAKSLHAVIDNHEYTVEEQDTLTDYNGWFEQRGLELHKQAPQRYFNPQEIDWYNLDDDEEKLPANADLNSRIDDAYDAAKRVGKDNPELAKFLEKLVLLITPLNKHNYKRAKALHSSHFGNARGWFVLIAILLLIALF